MIVYLLTSPSGKSYVGQTTRPLPVRWSQHKSDARLRKHDWPIQRAIRKYGAENFTVVVAARASSKANLDALEKFFIPMFGDYNIAPGGEGGAISAEANAKRRASLKGKTKSAEHCKAISIAKSGKPWT